MGIVQWQPGRAEDDPEQVKRRALPPPPCCRYWKPLALLLPTRRTIDPYDDNISNTSNNIIMWRSISIIRTINRVAAVHHDRRTNTPKKSCTDHRWRLWLRKQRKANTARHHAIRVFSTNQTTRNEVSIPHGVATAVNFSTLSLPPKRKRDAVKNLIMLPSAGNRRRRRHLRILLPTIPKTTLKR